MDTAVSDGSRVSYEIVFRTDASAQIGTGHLMRCLALADALALRRVRSTFVCRHLPPAFANMLSQRGHDVIELPACGPGPSVTAGAYGAWLGTTEAHDAAAVTDWLAKRPGRPSLCVVVDHYGLGADWEERLGEATGLPVAAIDDLDRAHAVRLLIDSTHGKTERNYIGRVGPECRLLIGSDHAILRPEFARLRPEAAARRTIRAQSPEGKRSILVAMGGGDPDDVLVSLLGPLLNLAKERDLNIHALVGGAYPHMARLEALSHGAERLTIHHNIPSVANLLGEVDLCIGASGTSTWERCCLGLPTMNLIIAENQRGIARSLAQEGIVAWGGEVSLAEGRGRLRIDGKDPATWVQDVFLPFLDDRSLQSMLSRKGMEIVDGFGTTRILRGLFDLLPENLPVELVPMTRAHSGVMFEWQAFPGQRRYHRHSDVPSWPEHVAWVDRQVSTSGSFSRVIEVGGIPAGVIRLDDSPTARRMSGHGGCREVSVIVGPEFQGRGVARTALALMLDTVEDRLVIAEVSEDNAASRRLFRACGFVEVSDTLLVFER